MKKFLAVLALTAIIFTGCNHQGKNVLEINPSFTLDSYYLIEIYPGSILYVKGSYRLAPYYNENGNLCRYIDGEIVEVTHEYMEPQAESEDKGDEEDGE